ncbi:MAG: peptidyl-prolyl cis-trans isomerase [Lachnospiraceae bacterium]|nr:peptidyl-prolyl cis-trans isomerase [Lachnospiraceae bacterium]
MKKKAMRLLAFIVILAVMVPFAGGCGQTEQAKKVVFSVGDKEVTLDEVWFYCKSVEEYYESYYSSMFSSPEVWTSSYPVEKEDGSTEESTLEDVAKRSAIKQIRQIKMAVSHAKEMGVSLTKAEQEVVVKQAKEFMDKVTKDEKKKMGITQELAEQVFSDAAKVEKIKTKLAQDEGIEISDEEAQTSKVYYIYFPTVAADASGNAVGADEEGLTEAKEDAQDALERIQAGNDIATVAAAYGMGSTSGEMNVDADTDLPEEISSIISGLKDGETYDKVIAAADGFYIIQMKQVIDETATADKKEELLSEKEQELLDKKFEEWGKDESFDYDKDVNWEYMKEIDFVANSSVTATTSEETATMEEKEDTSTSTTEEDTTTQE